MLQNTRDASIGAIVLDLLLAFTVPIFLATCTLVEQLSYSSRHLMIAHALT